jgi:hypothetical protein
MLEKNIETAHFFPQPSLSSSLPLRDSHRFLALLLLFPGGSGGGEVF